MSLHDPFARKSVVRNLATMKSVHVRFADGGCPVPVPDVAKR